jgi:hypothetical protein
MKVKLLKTMAGPDGCFHPGEVLTVSKNEGIELLTDGAAILLEDEPEPEVAEKYELEETAVFPTYKRRGRPPGKRI